MTEDSKKDISSAGMDRKLKRKVWTPARMGMAAGAVAVVGMFIYSFILLDVRSTLNVQTERLTINTVQEDSFQEFIQVTGTVQPIQTTFIDAAQGGVVQSINLESGTQVEAGDTILTLSNSGLQLSTMQQTSSLYDQLNNIRNSRLSLEQSFLGQRRSLASAEHQLELAEARYDQNRTLDQMAAISKDELEQSKLEYEYQQQIYELEHESFQTDSLRIQNQLEQLESSEQRLQQYLEATQSILDNLIIKVPTEGQLTMNEFNPGQSIGSGERIGQVDLLDSYKIRVAVDEYHLIRIATGLRGTFDFSGSTHELSITRVFPVIEGGTFEVDMEFVEEPPSGLTRGQSLRIRLELGASANALLLSRGGFYQTTGGNWVYKLDESAERAVRQEIRLGRQNPEYFEVLEGLQPGDQVITSGYDTFGDNEVLVLE